MSLGIFWQIPKVFSKSFAIKKKFWIGLLNKVCFFIQYYYFPLKLLNMRKHMILLPCLSF